MGQGELATARLRLRRWRSEDDAAIVAMHEDPEVTRYLNRPADLAVHAALDALMPHHWQQHGFGYWVVESREANLGDAVIGLVGVSHPTVAPEVAGRPELGWRLVRRAWGRGLGTEAASTARDHAFETLGLGELISIIHPENARSQRLAMRLGMTLAQHTRNVVLDREIEVWQLDAPGSGGS